MASPFSEPRTTQNPRNTQRTLLSAISAISACSALIVVSVVLIAQQPAERARTEALARRAAERLQTLQRESDRLASQESTLLGDLRKLEIEREIKAAELKQVDTEA